MTLSFPAWDLPAGLDTPCLVVDAGHLDHNIRHMAAALAARGVALRPHAKTHKSVEVARRQLAAGAVGITTATLSEAEVFADAGIDDLFVAYPVWAVGEKAARIRRILDLAALRVGVDSVGAARQLGPVARGGDRRLGVLVEVESGELRTGVRRPEDAVAVAAAAADAGLDVVGVFTHGGHSYASPSAGAAAADDEVRVLAEAADALAAAGHRIAVRSAGSTPTAISSARDGVTEERPGTYVFGDRQQSMLGATDPATVALCVAATVVSTAPGQVVIDAGGKALAKDKPPLLDGHGALPAYPHAVIEGVYDHHGVVRLGDGPSPSLGEVVAVIPNHVCPVVNLHTELLVVAAGEIVDRWPVDTRSCNR